MFHSTFRRTRIIMFAFTLPVILCMMTSCGGDAPTTHKDASASTPGPISGGGGKDGPAANEQSDTPTPAAPPKTARSRHVLLFGVDGVRGDALAKAETPNLDGLIANGSFTDTGLILGDRFRINDTISGPSWSSILTGVWADKHGVIDNGFKNKKYDQFPHVFHYIKQKLPDALTVSMVSWAPIDKHIVSGADVRIVKGLSGNIDKSISADEADIDTRDGQWHHLLVRRNGKTVSMFLDGKALGTVEDGPDGFDLDGESMFIGRDTRTDGTRFTGQVDNTRIWTRPLADEEIARAAKGELRDARDLLVWFDFEPAGQSETGELKNHADGAVTGRIVVERGDAPTYVDGAAPTVAADGKSAAALDLKQGGSVQGVAMPLTPPLKKLTQGDFTIETWFRTTDKGRGILLGNYHEKARVLNIELQTDNRVRLYMMSGPTPDRLEREEVTDTQMAREAAAILRERDPTAMFVYFHQCDATGHTIQFSPDEPRYVQAIANVDRHIGTVLQAMRQRKTIDQEDWLIIFVTDHGGLHKTHSRGHRIPEIHLIPMIVSGAGAKVGRFEEQAYIVDVAPTVLKHLKIEVDPSWNLDGRPIGLDD